MPAKRMGLNDRGLLRAGYKADVLVFDPEKFVDHAGRESTGMDLVLMEGKKVFADGILTDHTSGRLLKKGRKRFNHECI